MDVRKVLLKAGRYTIVTPIDSVRAALFFLLTPFLSVLREHQKASETIDLSMVTICLAIQIGRRPTAEQIRTVYTSMADLSVFENASVDLAWSGQSIEHVSQTDAMQTMREVHRVLKSGGFFCLDTPKWKLSRLLTRVGYLHPEHKLEYEPEQLVKMMQAVGFQVECVRAISPLPLSAQLGRFFRAEAYYATELGDKPDVGFSFFVRARKPY